MLTPNGASVRSPTSLTARRSSSSDIVAAARMPRPPAAEVAAASCGVATQPMPVWTIGYLMPNRSVRRVRMTRAASAIGHFLEPRPRRVESREQPCLPGRREAGGRDLVGQGEFDPGGAHDVVNRHAWMQRTQ